MARSLRIEYAGAFYHVMARGNRREAIYRDDDDRRFFLKTLGECCGRTGWRVHAWVLMSNHYHLFIETPEANLVEGMKWLQNTVTRRFNTRHGAWGRLFGDRYKSVLVEGDSPAYYSRLWDYIHLNPARSGLVSAKDGGSILDYRWSSLAGGYARLPERRPRWLAAEEGLRVMGYSDDVAGRRRMVEDLDRRIAGEGAACGLEPLPDNFDARMSHLRRGWYWGSQAFAERMRKITDAIPGRTSRSYRRVPQRLAHGLDEAERIVSEGLEAAGLNESELPKLRASDARKVAIARMVWKHTTASQGWIARRLSMRTAATVSVLLHRKTDNPHALPPKLNAMIDKMQEFAA